MIFFTLRYRGLIVFGSTFEPHRNVRILNDFKVFFSKIHSDLSNTFDMLMNTTAYVNILIDSLISWPQMTFFSLYFFFRGNDWEFLKTKTEVDMASLTLGELLKKKAEDGVRVLLMIWGETTSIMGTHDTETENFFKGSS